MVAIRVTVNDDIKAVQIWCTQDERNKDDFLAQIGIITDGYKKMKFKTVLYVSGTQPLAALTADILKHNTQCPAQA